MMAGGTVGTTFGAMMNVVGTEKDGNSLDVLSVGSGADGEFSIVFTFTDGFRMDVSRPIHVRKLLLVGVVFSDAIGAVFVFVFLFLFVFVMVWLSGGKCGFLVALVDIATG
jgi:hypothetical protein